MVINALVYLTIIVSLVDSNKPAIKLSFVPDEKYYSRDRQIEIQCELLNPTERTESAQLWYIDLKTGKRTPLSRLILTSPSDDAPEIFKSNQNKRYEYLKKNHIRIRRLHMEDSARYECNCPDCEENISKVLRDLHVIKLAEPKWVIEPGLPLHENSQTKIKCVTDDFYPYVGHKILRNHHEITNDGRSSLSNSEVFPQKFIWEATIQPTPDWHNASIRCIIIEGNVEQHTSQLLDVLFNPRFVQCDERQRVDDTQDQATLSCSYSGNPAPTLTWRRQNDSKQLQNQSGVIIQYVDEYQGKYKSLLKLDRTKFPSNNNNTGENVYQQFLSAGFLVQLTVNGNDRGTRSIHTMRRSNEIRSNSINNSSKKTFSFFLVSTLIIFNLFQRHLRIILR